MNVMIRVASYNIRKSVGTDWRRRPERILSVLNEIDADIVALQEIDRRFGSRITSLAHDEIIAGTDYHPINFGVRHQSLGWHGNTILARASIKVLEQRRLVLPALEPRGAVMVDLDVRGTVVRVIGMHLGLVGAWRKRQAEAVLEHLEQAEGDLPSVMMGDLNEWNTWSGCLIPFEQHHHVAEPGRSYPSGRPLLPFDRIIVSSELDVLEAGVHRSELARIASDHLPVWANIVPSARAGAQDAGTIAEEAAAS